MVGSWEFQRINGNGRKGTLFSMFSRIGLCVKARRSSFQGQWDCWIWLFEFVFSIILSEPRVQYAIGRVLGFRVPSHLQTRFLHSRYLYTLFEKQIPSIPTKTCKDAISSIQIRFNKCQSSKSPCGHPLGDTWATTMLLVLYWGS